MEKIKKTSDAKKGGLFVGKSHDEGGIPAIVVDTGQPIEVEGGEAIINKKATAKHWKELSKINESTGGVPIPPPDRADELLEKFEKGGKLTQLEKKTIHNKWKNLVNMTYTQLKKYYDSKDGKSSGLTQKEADDLGIDSGRESAVWIMKMKRTNYKDWTPEMWRWAKKQISFISRMRGNKGELMDNGKRTPKLKSLLIWGHNPYKYEGGGDIPKESKHPVDANSLQVMLKYASKEDAPAIQEQIAKLKQVHKEKYKKKSVKYEGGGKPSDIASAILGLKALLKYPDLLEKYDKENIEYTIKGLEILDKMHPSEIDPNDTSSGVKFIPYKDYEIMYDPDSKNYYANDAEFDSLEDAKAFLDSGKISDSITGAMHYEVYGYEKGGSVTEKTLLAPNGKPSNLTPEQYQLVRTPEFKAWFGDWENDLKNSSKVMDSNGEPMVVYHTTDKEFFIFDKKKSKEGFFFSPQKERLSVYNKSKIGEYFLNVKNPSHELFKSDVNYILSKGYDGIMDYGHARKINESLYEIIVFEPNQIKLADGTNTTFDSNNPDIRFEEGGSVNNQNLLAPNGKPSNLTPEQYQLVRTPEFKIWFGDWENLIQIKMNDSGIDEVSLKKISDKVSKVVDENGEPLVVYHGTKSLDEFYEFKKEFSKMRWDTFWFSPRLDTAEMYSKHNDSFGKIYECFLNVKKPSKTYPFDQEQYDGYIEVKSEMDYATWTKTHYIQVIQVVSSNQIKLADGTNTTFDSNNPDIRYKSGGKTEMTYKEKYNRKYGYDLNESHSLEEISKDTGVSLKGLQKIFNKGVGAYRTNPESVRPNVKSPEQWAMARVYSAVMGGKTARIDAQELKMEHGGKIDLKQNQLEIINRTNPAPNDYNTWIRTIDDIKTAEEVFSVAFEDGAMYPDFNEDDMREALESGYVTIFSSYPIKEGVFVTPSKMLATDYAGGKSDKVFSKRVQLKDVAWIDEGEGQYAPVNKMKQGGLTDQKDKVTFDVPLLIRLLELSREDIKSDADLHKVVENILNLKDKSVLTMDDYDKISQIAKEKLISQAHHNLTRKQGRPEYAPNSREIESEIERMISSEKSKYAVGGQVESDVFVTLKSPTEILDEINYNAQFKPEL